MKNKKTLLQKIAIVLRWYFRDFFSTANGYIVLPSNFQA